MHCNNNNTVGMESTLTHVSPGVQQDKKTSTATKINEIKITHQQVNESEKQLDSHLHINE
jgi:hypothetical protein